MLNSEPKHLMRTLMWTVHKHMCRFLDRTFDKSKSGVDVTQLDYRITRYFNRQYYVYVFIFNAGRKTTIMDPNCRLTFFLFSFVLRFFASVSSFACFTRNNRKMIYVYIFAVAISTSDFCTKDFSILANPL